MVPLLIRAGGFFVCLYCRNIALYALSNGRRPLNNGVLEILFACGIIILKLCVNIM